MASDLYVAAAKGDVDYLREEPAKDELDKYMTEDQRETPLHIAAMLGHLNFVEKVLTQKAELAKKQDSQGSTPLHLAAAKGYLNIVVSLLRVNPDMCDVCDNYKRNPLHVAAMKGHVDVLEYLVLKKPDAACSVVSHERTILHLCVMHNRLEAFKLLIDILGDHLIKADRPIKFKDLINSKDADGNTVLHLAAAYGDTKTMLFLTNEGVKPNIENSKNFTALDLLAQAESEQRSEERKRKWQNNMHKTLIVVATLLATMTFQTSITPPGGLSEGNSPNDANAAAPSAGKSIMANEHLDAAPRAGKSIMAKEHPYAYKSFITCNTISFIASLSIIMLFISGLPLKRHRITTWITMLVMGVAITFMVATYFISVFVFTPEEELITFIIAVGLAVLAWAGWMVFLVLCHFIRLIWKLNLVQKVQNFVGRRWAGHRQESPTV